MTKKRTIKTIETNGINLYYIVAGLVAIALLILCIAVGFPESIAASIGSFTIAAYYTYIPLVMLSYVAPIFLLFMRKERTPQ